MIIGEIKNTEQGAEEVKRFVGIAPVTILTLNPNKKELSEILDREIEEEPVYIGEVEYTNPVTGQVSNIKSVRLDFWLRNEELDITTKVSFRLIDTPFISKSGKCKVIDKYGRTAWVTAEEFKNKEVPMYASGPARIDKGYKTCMKNEEELIEFLKYYFGIADVERYKADTKEWVMIDKLDSALIQLDKTKEYFKGDVTEIKNVLKIAKANKVKVLLGTRIVDGNKYQTVFTGKFMRNSSNSTKMLERALKDAKENGRYTSTVFAIQPAKEYIEEATATFAKEEVFENPFASQEDTTDVTKITQSTEQVQSNEEKLPF